MADKNMPKRKEVILFSDKGTALSGKHKKGKLGHWNGYWNVKSDKTNKAGERTIVLKKQDRKNIDKKREEVIEGLLKGLKEKSKALRGLLDDVLQDTWDENIENLYERVIVKKQKVSIGDGCFKLSIGDGRRKNSTEIMLRN